MFEMDDVGGELIKAGIAVDVKKIFPLWENKVKEVFKEATLEVPPQNVFMQSGSRKGIPTEHLGYILAEMQVLPRMYPDAKWELSFRYLFYSTYNIIQIIKRSVNVCLNTYTF